MYSKNSEYTEEELKIINKYRKLKSKSDKIALKDEKEFKNRICLLIMILSFLLIILALLIKIKHL